MLLNSILANLYEIFLSAPVTLIKERHTSISTILTSASSQIGRLITWTLFSILFIEIVLIASYVEGNKIPLYGIFILPYFVPFIGIFTMGVCSVAPMFEVYDSVDDVTSGEARAFAGKRGCYGN